MAWSTNLLSVSAKLLDVRHHDHVALHTNSHTEAVSTVLAQSGRAELISLIAG